MKLKKDLAALGTKDTTFETKKGVCVFVVVFAALRWLWLMNNIHFMKTILYALCSIILSINLGQLFSFSLLVFNEWP